MLFSNFQNSSNKGLYNSKHKNIVTSYCLQSLATILKKTKYFDRNSENK